MRYKIDKSANYFAIFSNDFKTYRFYINGNKPITTPKYPEIEDIAINSKCNGHCKYCYVSANLNGKNFENISEKAKNYYSKLSLKERPFQIAIGGLGEPTLHPDFVEFVKTIRELNIIPNYTTNGLNLTQEVLNATKEYCGGVAVSWHPHLGFEVFKNAINNLKNYTNNLNIHIIIGQEGSYNDVLKLYNTFKDVVKYFVLLPYQSVGRAKETLSIDELNKIMDYVGSINSEQFAFGAMMYDYLKNNKFKFELSLYEPEMFSGFRVFDDTYEKIRYSSYDRRFKNE